MSKYKLYIFDLDGTLADTLPGIVNSAAYSMKHFGYEPPPDEFIKNNIGGGATKLIKAMLGPDQAVDEAKVEEIVRFFSEYYNDHVVEGTLLYPNVEQTINALADKALLAVATAKRREATMSILQHFGILDQMAMVVTMTDMPKPKPDPACVYMILDKLGQDKDSSLYIGDTMTDMLTAKNAGVDACAVSYGYGAEGIMQDGEYVRLIDSFEQLLEV